MTERLKPFIETLQNANSFEDVDRLVAGLRDAYSIEHAVYHAVGPNGRQRAALTYSGDWVDRYVDCQYQRVDPVVLGALTRFGPIDWRELDWSAVSARRFLGEAQDSGIGAQGCSIPIRGPAGHFALFSVNSREGDALWQRFLDEFRQDMVLIAHFLHGRVETIEAATERADTPPLSPRERDALTLLSLGHSRGQAADILKISEHTFRVYVDGARHKLGALNTTHAVALAMSAGALLV